MKIVFTLLATIIASVAAKCPAVYAEITAKQLVINLTEAINAKNVALMNAAIADPKAQVESFAVDLIRGVCERVNSSFPVFSASTVVFPALFTDVQIKGVSVRSNNNVIVKAKCLDTRGECILLTAQFKDKCGNCNYRLIDLLVEEETCINQA